jgi:hypothetical protein
MQLSRRDSLSKNVEWMPAVWLAAQQAQRLVTGLCISNFNVEDPKTPNLPLYVKDLKDIKYSSVSYTSTNPSNIPIRRAISKAGLNPRLIIADLLSFSCTRAIHTF